MKRFQNKVLNGFTETDLDTLGIEGWELVAVVERRAYLKRELTPESIVLAHKLKAHKNDPPILAAEPIKKGERVVFLDGAYYPATWENLCNPRLLTHAPYIYATKDAAKGEPVEFSFEALKP